MPPISAPKTPPRPLNVRIVDISPEAARGTWGSTGYANTDEFARAMRAMPGGTKTAQVLVGHDENELRRKQGLMPKDSRTPTCGSLCAPTNASARLPLRSTRPWALRPMSKNLMRTPRANTDGSISSGHRSMSFDGWTVVVGSKEEWKMTALLGANRLAKLKRDVRIIVRFLIGRC
ncbi:hypothetical protein DFH27DRAFT_583540 [Peziza echinospora]|nr:hypothetical protein DFH27DRAFT_583540 [Peziza echinospora]